MQTAHGGATSEPRQFSWAKGAVPMVVYTALMVVALQLAPVWALVEPETGSVLMALTWLLVPAFGTLAHLSYG